MDEEGKLMHKTMVACHRLADVLSILSPRYSLNTLLALITVLAILAAGVASWYHPKRIETAARARFDQVQAEKEAGLATLDQMVQASEVYLEASLAVPFVDRQAAFARHRDVVVQCERELKYVQLDSRNDEEQRDLRQLTDARKAAEKRLEHELNR